MSSKFRDENFIPLKSWLLPENFNETTASTPIIMKYLYFRLLKTTILICSQFRMAEFLASIFGTEKDRYADLIFYCISAGLLQNLARSFKFNLEGIWPMKWFWLGYEMMLIGLWNEWLVSPFHTSNQVIFQLCIYIE